jgi:F-type H+-transporting ATPase subunit b
MKRTMHIAALATACLMIGAPVWAQDADHKGKPVAAAPTGHGDHGSDHAAAAGEHGEHGAPAPINWYDLGNAHQPAYIALVMNFVFLAGLYYFLGRKPVSEALIKRRESVAKEIEEADRMRREAEVRALHYQEKLGKLEDELAAARQSLLDAGRGERERLVKDAEEKAQRMQRDAHFLVEQEQKQQRADLLRQTVEAAVKSAEDLLKKRITPSDHERLADDYLAELAAKTRAGVHGRLS